MVEMDLKVLLFLLSATLTPFVAGRDCRCYNSEWEEKDKNYFLCSCKKTWKEAQEFCATTFDAQLPVIRAPDVQDWLSRQLQGYGLEDTWISARGTKGDWYWVTGGGAFKGQGCFQDDPRDRDLTHQVELLNDVTPDVCIQQCRQDGYTYAGLQGGMFCYCGDSYGKHGMSPDCEVACLGNDELLCGGFTSNYIYNVDGVYSELWDYGEPSLGGGIDDKECLASACDFSWSARLWRSERCARRMKYMCQYERYHVNCTENVFEVGDRCVSWSDNEYGSWFDARATCYQRGGTLVDVTDLSVHRKLQEKLECWMESFWLAGTKVHWEWQTGDPVEVMYWATGQPSNEGDKCVVMSARVSSEFKWADSGCNQILNFICERAYLTTTTTTTTKTTPTTTPTTTTTTTTPSTTTRTTSTTSTTTLTTTPPIVIPAVTSVVTPGNTGTSTPSVTSNTTMTSQYTPTPMNYVTTGVPPVTTQEPTVWEKFATLEWIGIGLACLCVAILLCVIVACLCRNRKRKKKRGGTKAQNGYLAQNRSAFVEGREDFSFVKSGIDSSAKMKPNHSTNLNNLSNNKSLDKFYSSPLKVSNLQNAGKPTQNSEGVYPGNPAGVYQGNPVLIYQGNSQGLYQGNTVGVHQGNMNTGGLFISAGTTVYTAGKTLQLTGEVAVQGKVTNVNETQPAHVQRSVSALSNKSNGVPGQEMSSPTNNGDIAIGPPGIIMTSPTYVEPTSLPRPDSATPTASTSVPDPDVIPSLASNNDVIKPDGTMTRSRRGIPSASDVINLNRDMFMSETSTETSDPADSGFIGELDDGVSPNIEYVNPRKIVDFGLGSEDTASYTSENAFKDNNLDLNAKQCGNDNNDIGSDVDKIDGRADSDIVDDGNTRSSQPGSSVFTESTTEPSDREPEPFVPSVPEEGLVLSGRDASREGCGPDETGNQGRLSDSNQDNVARYEMIGNENVTSIEVSTETPLEENVTTNNAKTSKDIGNSKNRTGIDHPYTQIEDEIVSIHF